MPSVDNQASTSKTCSFDKNINDSCLLRRSARLRGRPSVSYNEIDLLLCAESINCKVPTLFNEIKNRDNRTRWEGAIREELDSLLTNDTWTLVPRLDHKNIEL